MPGCDELFQRIYLSLDGGPGGEAIYKRMGWEAQAALLTRLQHEVLIFYRGRNCCPYPRIVVCLHRRVQVFGRHAIYRPEVIQHSSCAALEHLDGPQQRAEIDAARRPIDKIAKERNEPEFQGQRGRRGPEQVFQGVCVRVHEAGDGDAPRSVDDAVNAERVERQCATRPDGLDALPRDQNILVPQQSPWRIRREQCTAANEGMLSGLLLRASGRAGSVLALFYFIHVLLSPTRLQCHPERERRIQRRAEAAGPSPAREEPCVTRTALRSCGLHRCAQGDMGAAMDDLACCYSLS